MPKVSVILPAYNGSQYIQSALDSVFAQSFTDFEVWVVDDGSTDDTKERLKPYGDRINYIYQQNQGQAAARNNAIFKAQGEYVAFQDQDDLWLPDKLKEQVAYLDVHPDMAVVYSDALLLDQPTGKEESWLYQRKTYEGKIFKPLVNNCFIVPVTALVRRAPLLEVGGFDSSLRSCEDKDLWLRMALKFQFGRLNKPVAKRRMHSDNWGKNTEVYLLAEIKVMQKLLGQISDWGHRNLLEDRLSKLYFELGYFYFARKNYGQARDFFRKSNQRTGLNLRSSLYFYSTYLDQRFINWIRYLKNMGKVSLPN